ncbi:hypothetical protein ANN_27663 [Periplaneta americana]|uniref:Uncharacterized protein n=1 Tax=Periplaneta americana TaxID=6978 RepID=A0ABQ8RWH8_PERAM|nr:hypothetical protein ANN_27663 [Periplaneta americana]
MDKTSIRSLQELMLLSDKVKLLVAHPGMGKSTEILTLAQEFKRREPACWVVTVALIEHTRYLKNCEISAVEFLLKAGKLMSDFATSLLKHELHHVGNIVILIDGFDEICPDYADKMILAEEFGLHTAILNEDKDYVLKLLSSPGCDVNGKDKGGRTPLHLAVINHTESSNFSPNKTKCEIIELLLQNHCDCNVEDEVFHWRPLTLADKIQAWSAVDCWTVMLNTLRRLRVYTTTKERLEMRDSDHRTPLFWAAVKGRLETVKMLVDKGANVNTDDAWKQTPLYYAISGCHVEVVKFLIENGANVKVCDKDGDSVIFTALLSGNLDILRLLIDKGADVDACNKLSKSLIFTAVERGNEDIVRLLIGKGADVNACNMYGESPVFAAVEEGNVDIVELLLDNNADINACNNYGESPLFTAVEEGYVDIVRL